MFIIIIILLTREKQREIIYESVHQGHEVNFEKHGFGSQHK